MKPFGPYTKLSRLGAGGTAEVWLAAGPNPKGGELLALKIVLPHRAEDESLRQMMQGEARTAALLKHPNIAEIFHIDEHEGLPYLAMEFVRGWTLSTMTKRLNERGERLTLAEACLIVHDAALGLHYAHNALNEEGRPLGLVHRDVSPQNLMTCEDGHTKVLDFGLAKATSETGDKTGGIKGKIAYMPPEQLESTALDHRVDVFALGAVLFELVCGRALYPGRNEAELLQQAFFQPQAHPRDVAPDLPDAIVEVLVKAIARKKEERTPSALALAQALLPFIRDDAQEALAVRLESLFEPLPRTAGEAMGLPPEPERMPSRSAPPIATPPPTPVPVRTPRTTTRPVRRTTTSELREPAAPPRQRRTMSRHDTPVELAAVKPKWSGAPDDEDDISVTDATQRPRKSSNTGLIVGVLMLGVIAVGAYFVAPIAAPHLEALVAELAARNANAPVEAPIDAPTGALEDRKPERKASAKKVTGVVTVESNRPALVTEDGKELGETPLRLTRPVGKRKLEVFTADGKETKILTVEFVAGKELVTHVAFK